MTLKQMIADMQAETLPNIPQDILQTMMQASLELIKTGIAGQALQVGEQAPEFTLPNTRGESVSLSSLLENGPVVLNFYRGAWCPYCNLELKALHDALPEITALGASLVSISPNVLEKSAAFAAENPFGFDILSDVDNVVAKKYRLVFTLSDKLRPIYAQFGIDLPAFDGNERFELPMPATYVLHSDGTIAADFVYEDYTQRMEPSAIIECLEKV
jgi:peroxiredoxin